MKKIVSVLGTRPEAIKMAPVIRRLKADRSFDLTILSTAQHRQMLDQVLSTFDIKPDMDLNIMSPNQSLCQSTSKALDGIGKVIEEQSPDMLLIQGDTNTVLAGALAAHYNKIPSGHVEAGLRTSDPYHPFPEEMNRRLTSKVAALHFAPTQKAVDNLLDENIPSQNIFLTGNTVIDAVRWISEQKTDHLPVQAKEVLNRGNKMLLVTAHRRENLGQGLTRICVALNDIVTNFNDVEIIYPVHLNPIVQKTVNNLLGTQERIHLIKPSGYSEFVQLMRVAFMILSDSGGVQEEAPTFGIPVLVLRDVTERNEAVEAGVAKLVGTSREKIFLEASLLLNNPQARKNYVKKKNPFGDGKASIRILQHIKDYLH